jgi:hypothetical protein
MVLEEETVDGSYGATNPAIPKVCNYYNECTVLSQGEWSNRPANAATHSYV